MDMMAITHKLLHMGASVFAAQETNVHWDPASQYQLYTQCRQPHSQIHVVTACSQEPAPDWYKPGGTLLMAIGEWTSRIIQKGSDVNLGCWSYLELVGKHNKRIIVVSGYRVCNQKFDAASNTVSAQQIRLLQASGVPNPQPRTIFLNDLIQQICHWRQAQKEVILCMDANEDVNDPKSKISRLYTETDLIDLHYHRYPGLKKPATHQRGSKAIDLIAGSPLAADALVTAWIHPFGDPVSIKGDHRMMGLDFDPNILFSGSTIPIARLSQCGVNSRHPQNVTKFCKHVVS